MKSLLLSTFFVLPLLFSFGATLAQTSADGYVQELNGRTARGQIALYIIADLVAGDTVYAHATNISGNLDPLIFILDHPLEQNDYEELVVAGARDAIREGDEQLIAAHDAINILALAWDDDSGPGYDAVLAFEAPADGDYFVAITGALGRENGGGYRLTTGVNAPQVLPGHLDPSIEARVELQTAPKITSVEEVTGTLTTSDSLDLLWLYDLQPGDVLQVYAETTTGMFVPWLVLLDGGGKALATSNRTGDEEFATLQYVAPENAIDHKVEIRAAQSANAQPEGNYRVLLGRNAPAVLTGEVETYGTPIVEEPIAVEVQLRIDQITDVDQISENFSIVGDISLEWSDWRLAFSPDDCDCEVKRLVGDRLIEDFFLRQSVSRWPEFTFYNQQGPRHGQAKILTIHQNGDAEYFERFSGTFQAPDFNFRTFPFDTQQFYVRAQALSDQEWFVFKDSEEKSGFGEQLGEEQWIVHDESTSVSTVQDRSQWAFGFKASRHLIFYVFRIMIPIFLIILVSWITFFLKDYGRRIEVTSANLLLFIAYNFTISDDLPRLGYLTLLDFILASTFVITALVVVVNVLFRRMEMNGMDEQVARYDRVLIWLYPVLYAVGGGFVFIWFFWISPTL